MTPPCPGMGVPMAFLVWLTYARLMFTTDRPAAYSAPPRSMPVLKEKRGCCSSR